MIRPRVLYHASCQLDKATAPQNSTARTSHLQRLAVQWPIDWVSALFKWVQDWLVHPTSSRPYELDSPSFLPSDRRSPCPPIATLTSSIVPYQLLAHPLSPLWKWEYKARAGDVARHFPTRELGKTPSRLCSHQTFTPHLAPIGRWREWES